MRRLLIACTFITGLSAVAAGVAAPAPQSYVRQELVGVAGSIAIEWDRDALSTVGIALSGDELINVDSSGNPSLRFAAIDDQFVNFTGGGLPFASKTTLIGSGWTFSLDGAQVLATGQSSVEYMFVMADGASAQTAFQVGGGGVTYDASTGVLSVNPCWIMIGQGLADTFGRPELADQIVGQLTFATAAAVESQELVTVLPATDTEGGDVGLRAGPDVTLANIPDISRYGPVGTIHAYAIGSDTCNIGNQNLLWVSDGTPGLAMNAFRLKDGRLTQIGQSWAKTACCAAAITDSRCGASCNGQGGGVLGSGCRDTYSSGWNSIQGNLKRKSLINPWSGAYTGTTGVAGNEILGRLQVQADDLNPSLNPGALYFAEGVYVGSDDAANSNRNNNATYRRVTISSFNMVPTGNSTLRPAIMAWREHGLGVGLADTRVTDGTIDVPGEGRFHTAVKVTDLGGGQWRYDYAIFNLSSDVAGGSLTIPVPAGVNVTNVGFSDVLYHSGDPYDNTDWSKTVTPTGVVYASPQTFAQNANSNALRWGTMYNFWFDADQPPTAGSATLGLFKPHTPQSVNFNVSVPSAPAEVPGDVDGDGDVDLTDLSLMLASFGLCDGGAGYNPGADMNGDDCINLSDLSILLTNFGS